MTPRFIKLHPRTKKRLNLLHRKAAADGARRVSDRIRAVLLSHDKKSSGEIASIISVSRSRVSEWLKIYEQQGVDGLMEGQRSGRPSRLTDIQKIIFCDIVDSGPIAYGMISGIWTAKIMCSVIAEEFNVEYHPGHVWKLLQDFGFSVQSPKRLLANADGEKRQLWTKETYPKIKKKPNVNNHA